MALADEILRALDRSDQILVDADRRSMTAAKSDLRSMFQRSRRFVFNREASTMIGLSDPDAVRAIALNFWRAVPSYPVLWLEWDFHASIRAAGDEPDQGAPERVGSFVEEVGAGRYRVTFVDLVDKEVVIYPMAVVWDAASTTGAGLSAPGIDLDADKRRERSPIEAYLDHIEGAAGGAFAALLGDANRVKIRRALVDAFVLGRSATGPISGEAGTNEISRMLETVTLEPVPRVWDNIARLMSTSTRRKEIADALVRQHAAMSGTWRKIVVALQLLNSGERMVQVNHVPRSERRSVRLGRRYLEHHTVELRVPARSYVESALTIVGDGVPRRRHEVRGSWVTRWKTGRVGCEHRWSRIDERTVRCGICGREKVWRRAHERGDAALGYVTKDYSVAGHAERAAAGLQGQALEGDQPAEIGRKTPEHEGTVYEAEPRSDPNWGLGGCNLLSRNDGTLSSLDDGGKMPTERIGPHSGRVTGSRAGKINRASQC